MPPSMRVPTRLALLLVAKTTADLVFGDIHFSALATTRNPHSILAKLANPGPVLGG